MWDEIILVWNMQLLLKDWKKLYIACSNKKWLKNFHKQFFLGDVEINRDLGDWFRDDEDWWKNNNLTDWNKEKQINNLFQSLSENEEGFYNTETWEQVITYVYELPKGFRSLIRLLKNIKDLKKMFKVDSILVWWWEILTEETPYSYLYWFLSTWILLPFKKLYLSWWIQVPKKWWNKILFNILTKKAEKIYVRDYELVGDLEINGDLGDWLRNDEDWWNRRITDDKQVNSEEWTMASKWRVNSEEWTIKNDVEWFNDDAIWWNYTELSSLSWNPEKILKSWKANLPISFFPDTSFFAILNNEDYKLDLDNYRWVREAEKKDYIIVNINKKAEQFYDKIYNIVEENYRNSKEIYFAWICKSPADDDIIYYHKLKKDFPWIKLLDWEDFYLFLDVLAKAEKVYTTRLHLFLVSYYLWLEVVPFVYQKKVEKMKQVLSLNIKNLL